MGVKDGMSMSEVAQHKLDGRYDVVSMAGPIVWSSSGFCSASALLVNIRHNARSGVSGWRSSRDSRLSSCRFAFAVAAAQVLRMRNQ